MIPNNTHHDTLSVYYDFLEDSGVDTEELREFSSNVHWGYEYHNAFGHIGGDILSNKDSSTVGGINFAVGTCIYLNYVGGDDDINSWVADVGPPQMRQFNLVGNIWNQFV